MHQFTLLPAHWESNYFKLSLTRRVVKLFFFYLCQFDRWKIYIPGQFYSVFVLNEADIFSLLRDIWNFLFSCELPIIPFIYFSIDLLSFYCLVCENLLHQESNPLWYEFQRFSQLVVYLLSSYKFFPCKNCYRIKFINLFFMASGVCVISFKGPLHADSKISFSSWSTFRI